MSFDVPDACTLPTPEQPPRLAEFQHLFTTAVRHVDLVTPTHVRLHLTGPAGLTAQVQDLAARESACCTFFTFTFATRPAPDGEAVIFDIEVPATQAQTLTALVQLAAAVTS